MRARSVCCQMEQNRFVWVKESKGKEKSRKNVGKKETV